MRFFAFLCLIGSQQIEGNKKKRVHNNNNGDQVDEEEDTNNSNYIPPGCDKGDEDNVEDYYEEEDKDGCKGSIEALENGLGGMSFATLTLKLPTLIYTWYDEVGTERCSVDMLLISGTVTMQLKVTVQKGGCWLKIQYIYPETFLAANRLVVASGGTVKASHSKTTALLRAIHEVKDLFNFEDVKADFMIKLPIKCDEEFVGDKGIEVVMYEHHDANYSAERQYYYMLHVEMISSQKAFKPALITGFGVVASPLKQANTPAVIN